MISKMKPSQLMGIKVPTAAEMEMELRAFMSPIMQLFHANSANAFVIAGIGHILTGLRFDPAMSNQEMDLLVQQVAEKTVASMRSYLLEKSIITTPVN